MEYSYLTFNEKYLTTLVKLQTNLTSQRRCNIYLKSNNNSDASATPSTESKLSAQLVTQKTESIKTRSTFIKLTLNIKNQICIPIQ